MASALTLVTSTRPLFASQLLVLIWIIIVVLVPILIPVMLGMARVLTNLVLEVLLAFIIMMSSLACISSIIMHSVTPDKGLHFLTFSQHRLTWSCHSCHLANVASEGLLPAVAPESAFSVSLPVLIPLKDTPHWTCFSKSCSFSNSYASCISFL